MAVFGVSVIEAAQGFQVAAIYRTAITVHELSQRIFVEHFLNVG